MDKEQQRIAIAEACPTLFRVMKLSGDLAWIPPGKNCEQDVDPLNDLNAMHEAEKVLTDAVRMNYGSTLQRVLLARYEENSWLVSATASQRAEAFLRTLGKWTA